jgi:hypothetical protein
MEKKYVGIVLASVFVLSLVVLGSVDLDLVAADMTTTTTTEPECTWSNCNDFYGEWCRNDVRMRAICEDDVCVSDTIENCGHFDFFCNDGGDITWCEGDPDEPPECTVDSQCPLNDEDAICLPGEIARNGYCTGSGLCTSWDQDCASTGEFCIETNDGAECIECDSDDDCAYYGEDAFCINNVARNGFCDSDNVCRLGYNNCYWTDEYCYEDSSGASCEECLEHEHCGDNELCIEGECVDGQFTWECNYIDGEYGHGTGQVYGSSLTCDRSKSGDTLWTTEVVSGIPYFPGQTLINGYSGVSTTSPYDDWFYECTCTSLL